MKTYLGCMWIYTLKGNISNHEYKILEEEEVVALEATDLTVVSFIPAASLAF